MKKKINIFAVITSSQLLSQSYTLSNFGVEKAGSCFCDVNVVVVSGESGRLGEGDLATLSWHLRRVMSTSWVLWEDSRIPDLVWGCCGFPWGCQVARDPGRALRPPQEDAVWKGWSQKLSVDEAGGSFCVLYQGVSQTVLHRTHFHFHSFCFVLKEPGLWHRGADSNLGTARSCADCAALAPAGCDRTGPQPSFLGNLHACPERKRGGEQMQQVRKDFRDVSTAADAEKRAPRRARKDFV